MQYFGLESKNYFHSEAKNNYDPNNRLAYYLDHSARASYSGPFDSNGVPWYVHHGHKMHHPVFSMLYALGNLEDYRKTKDENNRHAFLIIVEWLLKTQNSEGVWLSGMPMPKFGLHKEFPSAMIQSMGISTLVRAAILTGQQNYINNAIRALNPFRVTIAEGGVTRNADAYQFFEEYPSDERHHVLNGFIYALWGLLDLYRYNENDEAKQLWEEGLRTLVDWLPQFDMGYWSFYHIGDGMKNPATIPYHKLHIEQLKAMHEITGQKVFLEYYQRWDKYLQNRLNALRTLPQKLIWNLVRGL